MAINSCSLMWSSEYKTHLSIVFRQPAGLTYLDSKKHDLIPQPTSPRQLRLRDFLVQDQQSAGGTFRVSLSVLPELYGRSILWRIGTVRLSDRDERYGIPYPQKVQATPNLNRTLCAKCGKPTMETMGAGPLKLVFVPSKNFVQQELLPPVRLHVFYNRRMADIADNLTKYQHYWPSQFAIIKTIFGL